MELFYRNELPALYGVTLKRNGTLSGEATLSFSFCLPFHEGSTLKANNLLPSEHFFPFKSRTYFERAALSKKADRKSQKLSPFVKMMENMERYP